MKVLKIAIILGTRPEIIKLTSFIKECLNRRINFFIIHSNQHYDKNLDKIFFKELDLPRPTYNLKVYSGTHAEQTAKILLGCEKIFIKEKPDIVVVQGDTNTTLGGALSASKLHIKIAHIEAGLRSYDRQMPEEINRTIVDSISNYLFAPTKIAEKNLIKEGYARDKIFVTGNTIVDVLYDNIKIAIEKSKILKKLMIIPKNYFLLTMHRAENVDNKEKLFNILMGIKMVGDYFKLPFIYPIHPRTQKKINDFNLKLPSCIKIIPPVGFYDFLVLEKNARLIFTDSGGVQEEACVLKTSCITLRENTERPETIKIHSNILVGCNPQKILYGSKIMFNKKPNWPNPFGDGKSAFKILNILLSKLKHE